jgi:hypothetical protein
LLVAMPSRSALDPLLTIPHAPFTAFHGSLECYPDGVLSTIFMCGKQTRGKGWN